MDWNFLQDQLNINIGRSLQFVIEASGYDTITAISKIKIEDIENFVKTSYKILLEIQPNGEFLGIFRMNPNLFALNPGQKSMIEDLKKAAQNQCKRSKVENKVKKRKKEVCSF
jgi:hypothetical protein